MSLLTRLPKSEAELVRRQLSGEFLLSATEFDLEAIRHRRWVAAPVRDGITEEQAVWIEAAIADLNESRALCVTTEPTIEVEGYEVDLSKEGLLEFHYNCMLRAFVLAPRSLTFALLDEGDYFYIVAGPEGFVEAAVGKPVAEALDAFMQYARDLPEPRRTKEWLADTAERYRPRE